MVPIGLAILTVDEPAVLSPAEALSLVVKGDGVVIHACYWMLERY